jgi:hypothetical protein
MKPYATIEWALEPKEDSTCYTLHTDGGAWVASVAGRTIFAEMLDWAAREAAWYAALAETPRGGRYELRDGYGIVCAVICVILEDERTNE